MIKPQLDPAALPHQPKRPYRGSIVPGAIFAWEPDLPHARELCVVVELVDGQVTTRPLDSDQTSVNDESRFREAAVPALMRPHPLRLGSLPEQVQANARAASEVWLYAHPTQP